MSNHLVKSHNKTLLLYHLVFPVKYRREVILDSVGETLKEICLEISERFEIHFVEIGYESDHVHFLVQSVPNMSISKIVRTLKSTTAKELFRLHSEIKKSYGEVIFGQQGFMQIQLDNMLAKK
jgi:REP element-mobilizing transposase RayT